MVEANVDLRGGTRLGPVVEFGDGTDSDTLDNVFGGLSGYVVGINGVDHFFCGPGNDADGMWAFVVRRVNDENEPIGDNFTIPFEQVEKLHIY